MKLLTALLFVLSALIVRTSSAQEASTDLSNGPFFDAEPSIAIDPMNSDHVVVAWMGITGLRVTIHSKATKDGGKTWSAVATQPHFSNTFASADVSLAFNRLGEAFLSYVDYKAATGADSGVVAVARSKDGGITWDQPVVVRHAADDPELALDRPWITIDNSDGPLGGSIYLSTKPYFANITAPNHTHLKRSADDGLTWGDDIRVDDSTFAPSNAGSMAVMSVGKQSKLSLVYFSFALKFHLLPRLIYCSSTDGGVTLKKSAVADFIVNPDSNYQFGYAVAADPLHPDHAAVVWVDSRNGDPDVLCAYTTDDGADWSQPVRVNDDALKNGIGQDMVWCGYSPNGRLCVAWRDRRNYGVGDTAKFEIYAATSSDGGATFSKNIMISDMPSNYNQITKGNDFIGITCDTSRMYLAWGSYTTNWEIYFASVPLSGVSSVDHRGDQAAVLASYPNPAAGLVNLSFKLAHSSRVSVRVTNSVGQVVMNLPARVYASGVQVVVLKIGALSAGRYDYELSGEFGRSVGSFMVER